MFKDFFQKKGVSYFWEYDYDFGTIVLNSLFPENYQRFYSLTGDGIFNLLLIDGKIYHLKLSETKSMVEDDGRCAYNDKTKDMIVEKLRNAITDRPVAVSQGKYITFPLGEFIAKIEVMKKKGMPD